MAQPFVLDMAVPGSLPAESIMKLLFEIVPGLYVRGSALEFLNRYSVLYRTFYGTSAPLGIINLKCSYKIASNYY